MFQGVAKVLSFKENKIININVIAKSKYYDCYILAAIYSLAYGLMIFSYDGLFSGADWQYYFLPYDLLINFWHEHGSPTVGYLYYTLFILDNGGYFFFKLLTFVSHLFIGIICYLLLKRLDFISRTDAFFITALAMTFPNQESRLISCFMWYSCHFMMFMVAFYLMGSKKITVRIISLSLFFLSFFVNSLLVFYAVPILYYAYVDRESWMRDDFSGTFKLLKKWVMKKADFFLLPFVFFILQSTVWKVSMKGMDGYNVIYFSNLITSIPKTFFGYYSGFIDVLDRAFSNASVFGVILAIVILKFRPFKFSEETKTSNHLILFILGLFLFYCGAYPYFVVNKLLTTIESIGDSRDQMLILFGASFILYYGVQYLLYANYRKFIPIVFSALIALFVVSDINRTISYQIDCAKSTCIIRQLRLIPDLAENHGNAFLFRDNANMYNLDSRPHDGYEMNSWLKSAYYHSRDIDRTPSAGFLIGGVEKPRKNLKIIGTITIDTKLRRLSYVDKLRIVAYNIFDKDRYYDFLDGVGFITLNYEPLIVPDENS